MHPNPFIVIGRTYQNVCTIAVQYGHTEILDLLLEYDWTAIDILDTGK